MIDRHLLPLASARVTGAGLETSPAYKVSTLRPATSEVDIKTFQLSNDRFVVVKKNRGQLTVTIKQKDSNKSMEFTPSRF